MRKAIKDYTTVINQFPNFWTGLAYRARCYRRLGMTNLAELDEFKIFKAQMNKHLGIQQRWSAAKLKATRKRNEIDLDKYNQLVVEDEILLSENMIANIVERCKTRRLTWRLCRCSRYLIYLIIMV